MDRRRSACAARHIGVQTPPSRTSAARLPGVRCAWNFRKAPYVDVAVYARLSRGLGAPQDHQFAEHLYFQWAHDLDADRLQAVLPATLPCVNLPDHRCLPTLGRQLPSAGSRWVCSRLDSPAQVRTYAEPPRRKFMMPEKSALACPWALNSA